MKQLTNGRSIRTKRALKWIGSVLAAAMTIAGGGASAKGRTTAHSGLTDAAALLRYVASHRDDAAAVAYTVRADGGIDMTDGVLMHNAEERMPLGSIVKIVTLAAYAREVVAGRLNPAEPVAVREWERFYLPFRDGGAHPAALEALGLQHDVLGFAIDSDTVVPLDVMVAAMIQFSDNAAPDWLLQRLGPEPFRAVIRAGRLEGQDEPLPILGMFLSWGNHELPAISWPQIRGLIRLDRAAYRAHVMDLVAKYQDGDWRRLELEFLPTATSIPYDREATLAQALYPRGTARDYARMMAGIVTGTFISSAVSELMSVHLQWPMQIPVIADRFFAWGMKGGSLPAVVTEANFSIARGGDFPGKRRVAILMLRRLPLVSFAELVDSGAQSLFNAAVANDLAFFDRVAAQLGQSGGETER